MAAVKMAGQVGLAGEVAALRVASKVGAAEGGRDRGSGRGRRANGRGTKGKVKMQFRWAGGWRWPPLVGLYWASMEVGVSNRIRVGAERVHSPPEGWGPWPPGPGSWLVTSASGEVPSSGHGLIRARMGARRPLGTVAAEGALRFPSLPSQISDEVSRSPSQRTGGARWGEEGDSEDDFGRPYRALGSSGGERRRSKSVVS